jgi:hypothetical protein
VSVKNTIAKGGLAVSLASAAFGLAFLWYLGGKLDPLFSRAIRRAVIVGLILLLLQLVGFAIFRLH